MAILTSKGVRAPHQLKRRKNVRVSYDRRGIGNDALQEEINKALDNCVTEDTETVLPDCNTQGLSDAVTKYYQINHNTINRPVISELSNRAVTGLLKETVVFKTKFQELHCEGATSLGNIPVSTLFHRSAYYYADKWIYSKWKKVTVTEVDNYVP